MAMWSNTGITEPSGFNRKPSARRICPASKWRVLPSLTWKVPLVNTLMPPGIVIWLSTSVHSPPCWSRVLLVRQVTAVVEELAWAKSRTAFRSEEHTSELQSLRHLVCRLLLEKKQQAHVLHPRDT